MKNSIRAMMLLFSFATHAAAPLTFQVDGSKPQFVVTLASNPTTGFQWVVTTYDKTQFHLVSSHYITPVTKLIGRGGNMTFTFALIKGKHYPKTTEMVFTYARPWEPPSSGSPQHVTLQFH